MKREVKNGGQGHRGQSIGEGGEERGGEIGKRRGGEGASDEPGTDQ